MCCCYEKDEKFLELETFIHSLPNKKGALIEVLHKAQSIFGYLSEEVQLFVSKKLDIPASKVFGVVTFYSFFKTQPQGEYVINVCLGTACFVRGAGDVLKEFESQLGIACGKTTEDMKFTLGSLRCVGACGLAPVVSVNDKVYGHVTVDKVSQILREYTN